MDANNIQRLTATASNDEEFDRYLESKLFMNDPFIKSLIEKCITLGFSWETIKKAFHDYFETNKANLIAVENKSDIDYERLVDVDKFLERVIETAMQNENIDCSERANSNFDYDDGDDCDDEINFYNPDEFDIEKQFENMDILDSQANQMHHADNHLLKKNKPLSSFHNNKSPMLNSNSATFNNSIYHSNTKQQHQEIMQNTMNKANDKSNLRPIVVDGNDVGLYKSNQFNIIRIKQVVSFFEKRGHQIYVILPQRREEEIMNINPNSNTSLPHQLAAHSNSCPSPDQKILMELKQKGYIHYVPSKFLNGRTIICDDDCIILRTAASKNGIILSNDNFKKFIHQDEFKQLIEQRVLMYSFIDDAFFPVEDPLGRHGPNFENFIRFEPVGNQQFNKLCPYKKKCTYGTKCKFLHPERGLIKTAHQSVMDVALEQKTRLEIVYNRHSDESNSFDKDKLIKLGSRENVPMKMKDNDENMNYSLGSQNFNFNELKPKPIQQQKPPQLSLIVSESNQDQSFLRKMGSDTFKSSNQIKIINDNPNQKVKPSVNRNTSTLNQLNENLYLSATTTFPGDLNSFNSKIGPKSNMFAQEENYLISNFNDNNYRFNSFAASSISSLQQSISPNNANETVSFPTMSMLNTNLEESNLIERNHLKNSSNCSSYILGNENFNLNNNLIIGSSNSNSNLVASSFFLPSKSSLDSKRELQSQINSNTEFSKSVENKDQVNKVDKQTIRDQLSTILTKDQIDKVLQEHENETDIEKLIFLAGELSFDF
jgi:hypothetical protein